MPLISHPQWISPRFVSKVVLINSEFREDLKETHLCQPWSHWGVKSRTSGLTAGESCLNDVKTKGVCTWACLRVSDYWREVPPGSWGALRALGIEDETLWPFTAYCFGERDKCVLWSFGFFTASTFTGLAAAPWAILFIYLFWGGLHGQEQFVTSAIIAGSSQNSHWCKEIWQFQNETVKKEPVTSETTCSHALAKRQYQLHSTI